MRKTARGFNIYSEFTDSYRNRIIVQESSSINKACWIFVKNKDGEDYSTSGIRVDVPSPHLTPAQAKRLAKALMKFAESK